MANHQIHQRPDSERREPPTRIDRPDPTEEPAVAMAIVLASPLKPKPISLPHDPTTSPNHRPAVILPGMVNSTGDYQKLQLILKEHSVPSIVVNVSATDWLRNAAGLAEPYLRGDLRPRHIRWYLERVDEAVRQAKTLSNGETLSLIGHSAGGWLARIYMKEFGTSNVSLLVTLGTPHRSPPEDLPGVIDQTRGLLSYVDKHCPKAVFTPQLRYVCIAGRYIRGARFFDYSNGNLPLLSRLVGQGYKQVCGEAEVWGDGVVPEDSAHLEGALNISLGGVCHSPVGSDDELMPWYGSPAIVEQWIYHLLN